MIKFISCLGVLARVVYNRESAEGINTGNGIFIVTRQVAAEIRKPAVDVGVDRNGVILNAVRDFQYLTAAVGK